MWRGLYTAGAGMITESKRTDTLANNLANANTNGFKRDEAISREFEPMLIKRINDGINKNDVTSFKQFHVGEQYPVVGTLGLGSYIDEIATEHTQGAFETTGNPLDVAISGNGYFAIQTENGVRYTRDGNFYKSATGQIQTVNGQTVLGVNGQGITIPQDATRIMVGSKGEIYADDQQVGQLQLMQFDNRRAVLKQGNNLYYPQEGAQPQPAAGEVLQGVLERSNTNIVSEMVELINNYRLYEAGAKAVTTQDTMIEKSVSEVGRVGS